MVPRTNSVRERALRAGGTRLARTGAERRLNLQVRVIRDAKCKNTRDFPGISAFSVRERIRTSDLPLRRRSLYPAELRGQISDPVRFGADPQVLYHITA